VVLGIACAVGLLGAQLRSTKLGNQSVSCARDADFSCGDAKCISRLLDFVLTCSLNRDLVHGSAAAAAC
jgi:hypothetical protein